jgi:alpha-tubulin suppressor-like RCC1 family protein
VDFNSAQVLCWGRNQLRQLGVSTSPPNDPAIYSLPVVSDLGGDVVELDAGKDHTCAVRVITGALVCWGDGAAGQLGGGNPLNGAAQGAAATSGEFSCGRLLNGATLCWGRNDRGQLGNGTIVDSATPVPVEPPFGQVPIRRYRKGG